MDSDTIFVMGAIVSILAIPAITSAFLDGRTPRVPAIVVLIGGLLMGYAITQRPGAYSFETFPDVFLRVLGKFF